MPNNIGIAGLGNMGRRIAKAADAHASVVGYDIADSCMKDVCGQSIEQAKNVERLLEQDMIILALPGGEVLTFLQKYCSLSAALWVNMSTFVTRKQMNDVLGHDTCISCKIIGHSDVLMENGRPTFILDPGKHVSSCDLDMVQIILENCGDVVFDDEKKYSNVNLWAAEAAMKAVSELVMKLEGFPKEVVRSAVHQVLVGTAMQFPYDKIDYFHRLVISRNQNIGPALGLNENC
jgi:pyrroline-5-carboxylate reductase